MLAGQGCLGLRPAGCVRYLRRGEPTTGCCPTDMSAASCSKRPARYGSGHIWMPSGVSESRAGRDRQRGCPCGDRQPLPCTSGLHISRRRGYVGASRWRQLIWRRIATSCRSRLGCSVPSRRRNGGRPALNSRPERLARTRHVVRQPSVVRFARPRSVRRTFVDGTCSRRPQTSKQTGAVGIRHRHLTVVISAGLAKRPVRTMVRLGGWRSCSPQW